MVRMRKADSQLATMLAAEHDRVRQPAMPWHAGVRDGPTCIVPHSSDGGAERGGSLHDCWPPGVQVLLLVMLWTPWMRWKGKESQR